MKTKPPESELLMGKWSFIALVGFAAVLIGFSVWSLVGIFGKGGDNTGGNPASLNNNGGAGSGNPGMPKAEIERAHAQYHPPPPPEVKPVLPPKIETPTNRNDAELILQKTKAAANQKLVERLKQYVKDHPERDNRELEKEIKIREQRIKSNP
jgi:hypothetical protein